MTANRSQGCLRLALVAAAASLLSACANDATEQPPQPSANQLQTHPPAEPLIVSVAASTKDAVEALAEQYWDEAGVSGKIDLRIGRAEETLDALIRAGRKEEFDFVFIDADKESYWTYLEQSLVLLRKGGLIAIDNVLWSGKVADPATEDKDARAIHAFNRRLKNDHRVLITMLPLADGITLAMKK